MNSQLQLEKLLGAKLNESAKCDFEELDSTKEYLCGSKIKFILVACGTAMHAGLSW